MAQESEAQAFALAGAFDDAGDVGHDERAVIAVGDDAELGLHGGEGIVGNLGSRGGDGGEEGGLAGVGESDEADVSEEFEFEDDGFFDGGFAGLGVARGAVCGGGEVPVAEASAASAQEFHFLAVVLDFAEEFAGFGVKDDCSAGNVDDDVVAVLAE